MQKYIQKKGKFLKINGVEFPYPARGLTLKIIHFVNSGRNANGEIVSEVIGRPQYKLEGLKWNWLDADTWSAMLQELNKFFVDVEFFDMASNSVRKLSMYVGDRSAQPYWIDGEDRITHYQNCQCNLIDMGVQSE